MRYFATVLSVSSGFYLPGVAPIDYSYGSPVEVKVNSLTSVKTQVPYNYYSLAFCKPETVQEASENIGEILMGDTIMNSPYAVLMQQTETCKSLCTKKFTPEQTNKFKSMIDDEYFVNVLIENLPAQTRVPQIDGSTFLRMGYPIGVNIDTNYYLYNHINLKILFHFSENSVMAVGQNPKGARIVGFEIEPMSIAHKEVDGRITCPPKASQTAQPLNPDTAVHFTYSVSWAESEVRWASRWDHYLQTGDGHVHWFSIVNSLMVVFFLSGMIAVILLRTLHRDISRYNEVMSAEDAAEETGWKLVHGDVFRKPNHAKLLSMSVGSGAQLLCMSIITLFFAAIGFLSPSHRGSFLQAALLIFTLMGSVAGYTAVRFYTLFGGEDWKTTTLLTAFLYPGVCFFVFLVINAALWSVGSAGAIAFTSMFALLLMWFGISVPLCLLGAHLARRKEPIQLPVRTNQIPRQIPSQPWFMHPVVASMIGGVLPFGAVLTEMFFIMGSLWQHRFYYLFGFLVLVLVILVITCAEISIALTYFQLSTEDHRWWWRSFFASATSAGYMFVYSCLFFTARLKIVKVVSIILYFGYMLLASYTFFLLTGSIGVLSTFYFLKTIYGSIKID